MPSPTSGNPPQLENLLISAGLVAKEAKVYLLLLETGPIRAAYLQKKIGFKRGNTYALLNNLLELGLVTKHGTKFTPESPQKAFELLKNRAELIRSSLKTFERQLPQIMSSYRTAIGKPTLTYFEGEDGIKRIFEDVYAKKEENVVYGCVDLEVTDTVFPKYITEKMIPKRIKNKLFAITLLANSTLGKEIQSKDSEQLRKTHLLDKEKYPLPAEIDIYEDKIAMMTFTEGDFLGLIIEHPDLATTLKSIFKRLVDLERIVDSDTHQ